jgi:dsDNA-specific endonuclease/ATPase MutS2
MEYASFAETYSFDFDFCDVVATISQIFYDEGEIDLQANTALAMLELGTSHNRWFVERKFVSMVSPSITDELAERIVTEVDVREIPFARKLAHVMTSISVNDESFHSMIAKLGEG